MNTKASCFFIKLQLTYTKHLHSAVSPRRSILTWHKVLQDDLLQRKHEHEVVTWSKTMHTIQTIGKIAISEHNTSRKTEFFHFYVCLLSRNSVALRMQISYSSILLHSLRHISDFTRFNEAEFKSWRTQGQSPMPCNRLLLKHHKWKHSLLCCTC